MSDQLERLLSANKEIQDNMEVLQTGLGRKQTEFEKLLDERYEAEGTAHFMSGEFPVSQVMVACEPAL